MVKIATVVKAVSASRVPNPLGPEIMAYRITTRGGVKMPSAFAANNKVRQRRFPISALAGVFNA